MNELEKIGGKVDLNRHIILSNQKNQEELEKIVKRITEEKAVLSICSSLKIQTGAEGNLTEDVMIGQARFSTAIQLGNPPTMQFGGELSKYVQFITMFCNSFDKTINDPVALYEILMRHVKRPVKRASASCVLSDPSVNRYEEAMGILTLRNGQKNCVIRYHDQEHMNRKLISDSIADFEVLPNEYGYLVLLHYNNNLEYFTGEVVRDIIVCRLTKKKCVQNLQILFVQKDL